MSSGHGWRYRPVIIREMHVEDLARGFLETLQNLSTTGNLTPIEWTDVYNELRNDPVYRIFVAEEDKKVIGTITLLLERKFIHAGGMVGHIEDVAVRKGWQGQGVGRKLVEHALREAEQFGCYKVILDCGEDNVLFYEKLGFRKHEICMRRDMT